MLKISATMKRLLLCGILGLATTASCFSAETTLWDEVLDVVVAHIKRDGPDSDAAQFISMASDHAWARRTEMVKLAAPYLSDKSPDRVAGAVEVLYRLRGYRPMSHLGNFDSENSAFFSDLDRRMYEHIERFHALKSDRVNHALALYLGLTRSLSAERDLQERAKRELLNIVRSPVAGSAKEQALICLASPGDPSAMDLLLPFMLEDSPAARSLPYHFRNSYGKAAIPSLKRTLAESKSQSTRLEAAIELVRLRVTEGFLYLEDVALKDPEPKGISARPLERIKQFVIDDLSHFPGVLKDASSKEDIAAQLRTARLLLCVK